ncbi:hypothetical protein [Microbacterium arabinogalactanolyticum]|uniref:hypothetical protein n=1 Tax=Microbacterium arabinogalactanolyticum TaxID=69365 RepID=UPI0025553C9C|nr:hypothetical protein [Microbacterium arabinogalactanolyticum]GLC85327.1 hypothetical protein MIAR_19140 [Microbacterium arabinogalactanolyticum]
MTENVTAGAPRTIDRRTVVKGAAWSVPAIAAAVAMPLASASTGNPGCGCLQLGSIGAFTAQSVTALGLGTVTGTTIFNLDSSGCDVGFFKPAYTVIGLGGSISFNDGTTKQFTLGATSGAGTIGQISAFTTPFTVLGSIPMPNGLGLNYPKKPTSVTMSFTAIFIPILPLPQVECTYTLTFNLSTSSVGGVVLGTGTVNWTDLTPDNGVLTS